MGVAPQEHVDALVIGGGPAGSTAAGFLARAKKNVVLVESEKFPRFHIGESLLPASTPIFERLGVLEKLRREFIIKPGGKWYVGEGAWIGNFAACDPQASFAHLPYAFMVERSKFDARLLEHAAECGARVLQPASVRDFVMESGRIVGVKIKDEDGQERVISAGMIFDASGRKTMVARHMNTLDRTVLRRIALFAHFRATPVDPELKDGWFVGEMIEDGWVWLIPLEKEKISIGIVISTDHLKKASESAEKFYMGVLEKNRLFRDGISADREQISKVHVTENMGYSSRSLKGDGWVTIGDAGFFVDPCFSSGVHLAVMSAEMAVNTYLSHAAAGPVPPSAFDDYEKTLRNHEQHVSMMVRNFYNVSNSPDLQHISLAMQNPEAQRKFSTFVGGDFSMHSSYVKSAFEVGEMFLKRRQA